MSSSGFESIEAFYVRSWGLSAVAPYATAVYPNRCWLHPCLGDGEMWGMQEEVAPWKLLELDPRGPEYGWNAHILFISHVSL